MRSPRFGWFVGVQTLYRMSGLFATFFWLINSRRNSALNLSLLDCLRKLSGFSPSNLADFSFLGDDGSF
jgi:hypothetical protein